MSESKRMASMPWERLRGPSRICRLRALPGRFLHFPPLGRSRAPEGRSWAPWHTARSRACVSAEEEPLVVGTRLAFEAPEVVPHPGQLALEGEDVADAGGS